MEPIRETERTLHPVVESEEDAVSVLSPSSSRRSATSLKSTVGSNNPFATNIFRRSGYQRMPSGGEQELLDLMSSPGVDDLGIRTPKLQHRNSIPRVPVGSKTSPSDTAMPFKPGHDHTPSNSDIASISSPPIGSTVAPPPAAFNMESSTRNITSPPLMRSSDSNKRGAFTEVWDAPPAGSDRNVLYDDPNRRGSTINNDTPAIGPSTPGDLDSRKDPDEYDDETFYKKWAQPPTYCWSKQDIHQPRSSWLSLTIYVLSVYSTVMSGIWLVTAILQPRWGRQISSKGGMVPSNATLLTAIIAKTIELSFVTVFISCLGQILTRRSLIKKAGGVTLAEMTMRSLITHYETIPYAAMTLLGALSIMATIAASLYTTSSDALVSPKLKYGNWESNELKGYVRSSYANAGFASKSCPSLLDKNDKDHSDESCLNVQFSGQSYRNLLGFMTTWTSINENGTSVIPVLKQRPAGTTLLYDNTTMVSSWIETEHSNVTAHFEETGRIINNVTLALPHPGVYRAATSRMNGILQPDDLAGVGEYAIRAGVVSPTISVMCVNMSPDELEPLVYTAWPFAKTNNTGVGDQKKGHMAWMDDVEKPMNDKSEPNYLNRTVVDDIFKWGPEYKRRPPVFELYPADYNLLTNGTVFESDSIYMLGKTPNFANYTVCQLRSWVSPNCSTQFNISGTAGASMKAHCEDPDDKDSYLRSFSDHPDWSRPSTDWKWMADQWRLSMDLNGGAVNNNASNARILTQLALKQPRLLNYLPSMAEAIAVFAAPLQVLSAIDTPFLHYWDYDVPDNVLGDPGALVSFNASLITQQYTSGHINNWQGVFYVVLVLVFAINLFCLFYFVLRSGFVTDFTEPQNLFALAVNSPPSAQLNGSCGGGPEKRDLVVPWRVAYVQSANHYFFEEANEKPWRGKYKSQPMSTSRDLGRPQGTSYKRLSSSRGWL